MSLAKTGESVAKNCVRVALTTGGIGESDPPFMGGQWTLDGGNSLRDFRPECVAGTTSRSR